MADFGEPDYGYFDLVEYDDGALLLYKWRKTDKFHWPVKVLSYSLDTDCLTVEYLYEVKPGFKYK